MKKSILFLFILCCTLAQLTAQNPKQVLYILATDAEKIAQQEPGSTDAFNSSVIGFWNGAQIALDEMKSYYTNLRVVVRDVNGNDTVKLQHIFNEATQQKPDLMIAAVPKNLFKRIAQFALEQQIPVVNPFSTDPKIIQENPYVYKVTTPDTIRPNVLQKHFANANYVIWNDMPTKGTPDHNIYKNHFTQNQIPFKEATKAEFIAQNLSHYKPNIIIANSLNAKAYATVCNGLTQAGWNESVIWILPEKLMSRDDIDFRIFKDFGLYFFSDCFVDTDTEDYLAFQNIFHTKFNTIPTLNTLAPQGYDVTNYFVGRLCNSPRANATPLSYYFHFTQNGNDGFENMGIRLIEFTNLIHKVAPLHY